MCFLIIIFVQYLVGNQFLPTNKAGRGDQHAEVPAVGPIKTQENTKPKL